MVEGTLCTVTTIQAMIRAPIIAVAYYTLFTILAMNLTSIDALITVSAITAD